MKKLLIIIWTIAGILSCIALGCQLGYKSGYNAGLNRASDCTYNGGVIMQDKYGEFCWFD